LFGAGKGIEKGREPKDANKPKSSDKSTPLVTVETSNGTLKSLHPTRIKGRGTVLVSSIKVLRAPTNSDWHNGKFAGTIIVIIISLF